MFKEVNFMKKAPGLKGLPIYVKFGEYKEELKTENNFHFGVKLATRNQYIRFLKISSQMLSNYWTLSLWLLLNEICLIWNKTPKNTVY
jgi:hypothetical protein